MAKELIEVDRILMHTGDVKVVDFIKAVNNYMAAQNVMRQNQYQPFKAHQSF